MIQWDILIGISSATGFLLSTTPRPRIQPQTYNHKMISQRWPSRLALAVVCLLGFFNRASALPAVYCSDINTSSNGGNSSIYQSYGLCYNFCVGSYAFAILQGSDCWCSDYAPDSTTTGCTNTCPGYPADLCGGDSTYGYFALSRSPSGTTGAGASSTSATTAAAAEQVTVTAEPSVIVIYSTVPAPTPSSSPSSSSSTTSSQDTKTTTSAPTSSSWTPTPVISLQTVTGQVRTVTITPTVPPNSQNSASNNTITSSKTSGGLGTGGAVGLTVGLVALVAIIAFLVFIFYRKRQRDNAEAYGDVNTPEKRASGIGFGGGEKPKRTMSENSRYVLGTDGRQVVETWEAGDGPGSRRSRLMPVDPRLDPFAPVYQRGESSKSRESVNTIRDDMDYSRRVAHQGPILRATNPDE